MDRGRPLALALAVLLAAAPTARTATGQPAGGTGRQPAPPPPPPRPATTAPQPHDPLQPGVFEPDLERIRKGLSRPDRIDLRLPEGTRPMFRVDVEGKLPDISTWLGDPRELSGPRTRVPSYHEEFLRLVTPEEIRAAYTSGELAQVLATAFAGQLALQALTGAIKGAVRGARQQRACEEVRDSLRQLNEERARAGLPPVAVPEC